MKTNTMKSLSIFLLVVCVPVLLNSCEKELDYPDQIYATLNDPVTFDATENQILKFDIGETNMLDVKITSLLNNLCPEGVTCFTNGSAIITLDPLNEPGLQDTIVLYYPRYIPSEEIGGDAQPDSAYIIHQEETFMIKLLEVKKVYYDKRRRTKSVVSMMLRRADD
jgi:hypothetical protein